VAFTIYFLNLNDKLEKSVDKLPENDKIMVKWLYMKKRASYIFIRGEKR